MLPRHCDFCTMPLKWPVFTQQHLTSWLFYITLHYLHNTTVDQELCDVRELSEFVTQHVRLELHLVGPGCSDCALHEHIMLHVHSPVKHVYQLHHTHTHTWSAPSKTTDCVTDGRRAQFAMNRSCCIDHTAKPCQWCWRPAACELPVSSPTRQPASSQMIGWPTGMWCATVLDQVQPWSVSWVADRISSCWPWRCPCNALVDHTVGVWLTTTVWRRYALVSDWRPCE